MGTRSLTTINDYDGRPLLTMYRQFDGYVSGHGVQLAGFLKDMELTNGFDVKDPRKDTIGLLANGMGCVAAQIVALFKTRTGDFYIEPAGTTGYDEEYRYTVDGNLKTGLRIKVEKGYADEWETVLIGTPKDVIAFNNGKVPSYGGG